MLEIYITFLILVLIITFIYKKFFQRDYNEGEWLVINKDIQIKNNLDWDISHNSQIKVANFHHWKSRFFGRDLFVKMKEKEGILARFDYPKQESWILDVLDRRMNSVHHLVNPREVLFTSVKKINGYFLEPKKKYIFFLRDSTEKNYSKIYKIHNVTGLKITEQKSLPLCVLDERELSSHLFKRLEDVKSAMDKRKYYLADVVTSEEYLSIPSNTIANKAEINSEIGDVIVVVCTNKTLTSQMKNHVIEVNSKNNNFDWKPSGEGEISHLLLDNCDDCDNFTFYERTTNVTNTSKILNFGVMLFKKK